MDRRKFFLQSRENLTGVFENTRLGRWTDILLNLVDDKAPASQASTAAPTARKNPATQAETRFVLRPGEPVDSEGLAFPDGATTLAAVYAPDATPGNRLLVGIGHRAMPEGGPRPAFSGGLTVVEMRHSERGWAHVVGSSLNRVWSGATEVALTGTFLGGIDASTGRNLTGWERKMLPGLGPIRAIFALPWKTFLCAEQDTRADSESFGWLVEVNPLVGTVVKRFSLGRTRPLAFEPVIHPGRATVVYVLGESAPGEGRLFKFVSHQKFNGQRLDANAEALMMGNLWVADLTAGQWRRVGSTTEVEAWKKALYDPHGQEAMPEPILKPEALSWDRRKNELSLTHAGAISILAEENEPEDSRAFGYALLRPADLRAQPVATASSTAVPKLKLNLGNGESLHFGGADGTIALCASVSV